MNVLERAARSKELLESMMFKEAQKAIRDDIISKLETVAFDDHEKQHELVLMLQLTNRHKTQLQRWVDDGKVETKVQAQSEWRQKVIERAKALVR